MDQKHALITGATSQDASYLTKHLLSLGYKVSLTHHSKEGNFYNLNYLQVKPHVEIHAISLIDINEVLHFFSKNTFTEVYHLASMSSVSKSMKEPEKTLSFNYLSTLNLLESIRRVDSKIKFFHASSSEIFGHVNTLPITGSEPFLPNNPYGYSKSFAHQLVHLYHKNYGLYAVNGILFLHESVLRPAHFFIKKVINESIEIKKRQRDFLKLGNLDIKRDFGYAPEYVKAMHLMLNQNEAKDYLICSGKSTSLRDIVRYVFNRSNIDSSCLIEDETLKRTQESLEIYGDARQIKQVLGWDYSLNIWEMLDLIMDEELNNQESKIK